MSIGSFSPRPRLIICVARRSWQGSYKPEIIVNVLCWSFGGAPNPAEAAQRLEGSRFVGRQFYRLAASGSPERPMVQVCQSCASIRFRTGPLCKNIALGDSREPPASWFCCVSARVSSVPAARFCNEQKRLPSGPWACNRAGLVGSTNAKRMVR